MRSAWTRHPSTAIVVSVRNERNEELARHVVNVGALQVQNAVRFSLSIDVADPKASQLPRRR